MTGTLPCVTMMRRAPVAAMAPMRPGQSAWSDSTKPRSQPPRLRLPRTCIQPLAKAVLASPKRRIHGLAAALGGQTTSARLRSRLVLDRGDHAAFAADRRRQRGRPGSSGSTAPCTMIGPIDGSTPLRMRWALPKL